MPRIARSMHHSSLINVIWLHSGKRSTNKLQLYAFIDIIDSVDSIVVDSIDSVGSIDSLDSTDSADSIDSPRLYRYHRFCRFYRYYCRENILQNGLNHRCCSSTPAPNNNMKIHPAQHHTHLNPFKHINVLTPCVSPSQSMYMSSSE